MVSSQNDDLLRVSHLKCKQEADHLTALLASIDVIAHEEVSRILSNYVILLFLLVFVTHLLEHVQKVCILAVNITKYFDWSFKHNEWLLVFETLLDLLDEEVNHLDWKVDEWHALGVFCSI